MGFKAHMKREAPQDETCEACCWERGSYCSCEMCGYCRAEQILGCKNSQDMMLCDNSCKVWKQK